MSDERTTPTCLSSNVHMWLLLCGSGAVGLLRRLLLELDAAALELLVRRVDVVRHEEQAAGDALGDERLELCLRLRVEDGRARNGHERDGDVGLAGDADGEPAEVAELRHRDVVAELEPELLRVEGERLVLVAHPDVDVRELLQHRVLLVVIDWEANVAGP